MSTLAIQSVRPVSTPKGESRSRVACALAPGAVAELVVTRQESIALTVDRALILETIEDLDQGAGLSLAELNEVVSLPSEKVLSNVLSPLVNQGLVTFSSDERISISPTAVRSGLEVQITRDTECEVLLIGEPLRIAPGVDIEKARRLGAFESSVSVTASKDDLAAWKADAFDESVRQVRVKSDVIVRMFAVATMADESVRAFDHKQSVGLRLASNHPFRLELARKKANIIQGLPELLRAFGTWDETQFAVICDESQWERWSMAGGSLESELIVRGDIDVAVYISCVPSDERAAHAMLITCLLRELDSQEGSVSPEAVQHAVKSLRASRAFFRGLDTPSKQTIEAAAWNAQRWALSYRLAATDDGL